MHLRYVIAYAVAETAAFVAMVVTLGFGWAVAISLGAAVVGFLMLRWQGRKVFRSLRRASVDGTDTRAPLADTALIATSTVLLVTPGVVSTLMGMLLLTPPVRRIARPILVTAGTRRAMRMMSGVGIDPAAAFRPGTVVDGDVVEGDVVDSGPVGASAGNRGMASRLPPGR